MKPNTGHNNYIGNMGENIATMFLVKQGYDIIERNYLKKWGEIDIVAKKDKKLHFVEVKTVSCSSLKDVTYETLGEYSPEDNVHYRKRERLGRVFSTYLMDMGQENCQWYFDVICVYYCENEDKALVQIIKDIII